MSFFVNTLRRLVETASASVGSKTLLNVTTKSSIEEVSYLSSFQEFELGWSVKTIGMFEKNINNKYFEYIRWISSPSSVTYEIDDGTTIDAGKLDKFIDGKKLSILSFDCDDGIETAIEGFPFDSVLAERIIVNSYTCDFPQVKKQLNTKGYEHVDSGIFIPSYNIIAKFVPRKLKQKHAIRGHTRVE